MSTFVTAGRAALLATSLKRQIKYETVHALAIARASEAQCSKVAARLGRGGQVAPARCERVPVALAGVRSACTTSRGSLWRCGIPSSTAASPAIHPRRSRLPPARRDRSRQPKRARLTCNLPVQFSRLPSTRLVTSARGSRRQRRGDSGLATVFERRRRGGRRDELDGDEPQVEANGLKRLGSGGGGGDAADIQEAPGELDLAARRGRAG